MANHAYSKLIIIIIMLFVTIYFYNQFSKTYFEWNKCNLLDQ